MRFGTVKLYRFLLGLYPIVFMMFPILSYLGSKGESRIVLWTGMVILLIFKACGNMSYVSSFSSTFFRIKFH